MANRIPLIVDSSSQRIKELPSGDNLDLTGNGITAVRDILPEADSLYDLGSAEKQWRDLYLSGNSIKLGGLTISRSGSSIQFSLPGATSTLPISNGLSYATITGSESLTNKTINLSGNSLSGTLAEFNSALSDADFASLAGTETLTNKTLTSPTINGGSISNLSTITTTGDGTIGGNLTVTGDLTINGTTTTISTTNLVVEDKNIILAEGSTTDVAANGGGLTLKGATDKLFVYNNSIESWESNVGIKATTFALPVGVTIDEFSSDPALQGNSNTAVPTEAAVKSYVDAQTSSTDVISEGSTNLYFTTQRARESISVEGSGGGGGGATTFTSQRTYNASGSYGDMGTSFSSDTPNVWFASSFGWSDVNNYNTLIAFTSGTPFTMNFRGTTFNGTLTSNFVDGDFGKTATVSWTGSAPTVSFYDSPNSFTIGGNTYSNQLLTNSTFDYFSGAVSVSTTELSVVGPGAWIDSAEFDAIIALTTGAEISVVYQGTTYTGTLTSGFTVPDPEFDPDRRTASITWQSSSGLETFTSSVDSITPPGGGSVGSSLLEYDNTTGVFSFTTPDTDVISEGSTNLYFTTQRARDSVSSGAGLSYSNGQFSIDSTVVTLESAQTLTNKTLGATTIAGNLIPNTNETYDLGSASNRFRDLYLKGASVYLGDAKLVFHTGALRMNTNVAENYPEADDIAMPTTPAVSDQIKTQTPSIAIPYVIALGGM